MTEAEMLFESGVVVASTVALGGVLAICVYFYNRWKKKHEMDKYRRPVDIPPKSTGNTTMDLQNETVPNVSTASLRYLHELDRRQLH